MLAFAFPTIRLFIDAGRDTVILIIDIKFISLSAVNQLLMSSLESRAAATNIRVTNFFEVKVFDGMAAYSSTVDL
jgi:hypothetical protein